MKRLPVLAGLAIATAAGTAHASGIPMATEWDMARDGGRILNSLVVLGAVVYLVIRYGAPVFRKRAEDIMARFARYEEAREQAAAKLKEYEERLARIEIEASRIRGDAEAEGELIKKKAAGQAEEAAKRMIDKAAEQIELEAAKAREKLMNEAMEAAVNAAEEILKKNLGPEDHKRVVKSFLAGMEKVN
ncbi:MAG: ATP synthase F0 subunit B [Nitrospinae bacterium]|nr:ATP synthase F0 subunit B [Nitrospinota bacterium]